MLFNRDIAPRYVLNFLGDIELIPTYSSVQVTGILANVFAMSSKIRGVCISHTYVYNNNLRGSCSEKKVRKNEPLVP